ncbi:MAG TPA: hypothetical protein VM347_41420 [Nonomuraea sp.]|nr:hypothetical protein [Nonomuraea sp.]
MRDDGDDDPLKRNDNCQAVITMMTGRAGRLLDLAIDGIRRPPE